MTETPDERYERLRAERPWLLPAKLPPPKPRPVPELGWCARCKRVNPRPGFPDDQDGHDWVEGLDDCGYVAGVICPECVTTVERLDYLVEDREFFGGIFINPADKHEDDDLEPQTEEEWAFQDAMNEKADDPNVTSAEFRAWLIENAPKRWQS